jgi:tetratricopeptide (TPR) repeat protein
VVLGLLLGLPGCPFSGTPVFIADTDRTKGLPSDPIELVRVADAILEGKHSEKAPELRKTDRGLAALELALKRGHPDQFQIQWKLARACFMMTESVANESQRHVYARRGVEHAQQALQRDAKQVQGHYYQALNTAKVAEVTSNVKLIASVVKQAQRAAAIDERFDDAGPLRILGKIYITAPTWPVSVGSPEKAVEVLKRAVTIAPVPLNRVFLAEAYFHDEEHEKAELILREALQDSRVNQMDERWRKEAEEFLKRIGTGSNIDPKTDL